MVLNIQTSKCVTIWWHCTTNG